MSEIEPHPSIESLNRDILAVDEWTGTETLAMLADRLKFFGERIREMRRLLDDRMLEAIEETKQDIVVGPIRYYAGIKKETKCIDHAKALAALFEACGGDVDRVAECIASNGLKHGACKGVLTDKYDQHFKVEEKPELKEGVPKKSLLQINENFTR